MIYEKEAFSQYRISSYLAQTALRDDVVVVNLLLKYKKYHHQHTNLPNIHLLLHTTQLLFISRLFTNDSH